MGVIAQYLRVSEDELTLFQAKSIFLEKRILNKRLDRAHWLDIDKIWDGIIYLLTGDGLEKASGQLLRVIISTRYIDEQLDFGCGPAHFLDADEVQDLYAEIASWDREKLNKRFDANQMRALGLLPNAWTDDEAFEYLVDYFNKIKAFYHKAALNNEAIVGVLSNELWNFDSQTTKELTVSNDLWAEKMVFSATIIASCTTLWQLASLFL